MSLAIPTPPRTWNAAGAATPNAGVVLVTVVIPPIVAPSVTAKLVPVPSTIKKSNVPVLPVI